MERRNSAIQAEKSAGPNSQSTQRPSLKSDQKIALIEVSPLSKTDVLGSGVKTGRGLDPVERFLAGFLFTDEVFRLDAFFFTLLFLGLATAFLALALREATFLFFAGAFFFFLATTFFLATRRRRAAGLALWAGFRREAGFFFATTRFLVTLRFIIAESPLCNNTWRVYPFIKKNQEFFLVMCLQRSPANSKERIRRE
jgi:hypothetical protein